MRFTSVCAAFFLFSFHAQPAAAGTLVLHDDTIIHTRSVQIAGDSVYYVEYDRPKGQKEGKRGEDTKAESNNTVKRIPLAKVRSVSEKDPPKSNPPKHSKAIISKSRPVSALVLTPPETKPEPPAAPQTPLAPEPSVSTKIDPQDRGSVPPQLIRFLMDP